MNDEKSNTTERWFKTKLVAEKVWLINDNGSDNIYLVEGTDKALLIDTGLGVANLNSCVKDITKLPVIVVNTHGHPDHVGGNFQFTEVYAHPLDFELIKRFSSKEYHKNTIERAINKKPVYESFFLKDIENYNLPSMVPITSGYVFNLGNRKLEVIEVPGHTEGSIVLLDAENKLLFAGDNNTTLVWLFPNECLPLESYLQSLQKLNKRNEDFDNILPGHGYIMDKSFINEQIICAKNIISGNGKGEKYETFLGSALLYTYKRASIAYTPDNIYVEH